MITALRRRWPLGVAIAFAALFIAGQLVVPAPPDLHATGEQIIAYYRDHHTALRVSVWLTTLAGVPFAVLVAWFRQQVRGAGRDVVLLGGAAIAIETAILTWVNAGLALHPDSLDPRTARALADIVAYYGPVLTISVILLAAPLGWTATRTDSLLPTWLGALTAVLVVEQAIETVTIFGTSGFIAPGGPMNLLLGAGLFIAWAIAAAAALPSRLPPRT